MQCSIFIAVSVDGFIARPDGDVEWLHKPEYASNDRLGLDYGEFISMVDGLIMGRKSFEKVLSFSTWPYEGVPVIVLSSQDIEIPDDLNGKVTIDRGDPKEIVSRRNSAGNRHLYIDGGSTIQRFLQSGLITDLTITQIPVLLGNGIPLFGSIGIEIQLKHVQTTSSKNGFVQSRYQVLNVAWRLAAPVDNPVEWSNNTDGSDFNGVRRQDTAITDEFEAVQPLHLVARRPGTRGTISRW